METALPGLPEVGVPQHASILVLLVRMKEAVLDQIAQVEAELLGGRYFSGEQRESALREALLAGQREQDVVDVAWDIQDV